MKEATGWKVLTYACLTIAVCASVILGTVLLGVVESHIESFSCLNDLDLEVAVVALPLHSLLSKIFVINVNSLGYLLNCSGSFLLELGGTLGGCA